MVKPDTDTMQHYQINHFISITMAHNEPDGICKYLVHHILAPSLGFYVSTLSHFHSVVQYEQSWSVRIGAAGRRGGLVDPSVSIESGIFYQSMFRDFHQEIFWQRGRRQ